MSIQYISKPDGTRLAYHYTQNHNSNVCVMFCGGYRSDMNGTKALYYEQACADMGVSYIRFDYSGHGASDGAFKDGLIGDWASDAVFIADEVIKEQKIVLIGSSMGGWMAFLLARARPERVKALIGIAAAPDFTQDIYDRLSEQQKADLHEKGYAQVPNDYSDEPYHYSKVFYEESLAHYVLADAGKMPDIPIVLVQGGQDKDVHPRTPNAIQSAWPDHNIEVVMIDDADHRLSRPEDLKQVVSILKAQIKKI